MVKEKQAQLTTGELGYSVSSLAWSLFSPCNCRSPKKHFFFFLSFLFETGPRTCYVARLALNLSFSCLCLPSMRIIGIRYHSQCRKKKCFLVWLVWFSETVFLVAQAGVQLVAISLPQSQSRYMWLQRSPGPSLTI